MSSAFLSFLAFFPLKHDGQFDSDKRQSLRSEAKRNYDIQNSAEGKIQFEILKCVAILMYKVNLESNCVYMQNITTFPISPLLLEVKVKHFKILKSFSNLSCETKLSSVGQQIIPVLFLQENHKFMWKTVTLLLEKW